MSVSQFWWPSIAERASIHISCLRQAIYFVNRTVAPPFAARTKTSKRSFLVPWKVWDWNYILQLTIFSTNEKPAKYNAMFYRHHFLSQILTSFYNFHTEARDYPARRIHNSHIFIAIAGISVCSIWVKPTDNVNFLMNLLFLCLFLKIFVTANRKQVRSWGWRLKEKKFKS